MTIQNRNKSFEKKFVKLQTRKVISAYGGSGSLIETPFGALLIENFDKWPFFKGEYKDAQWSINIQNVFHLNDNRLLQRLNHKNGFSKLEAFVHVPDNTSSSKGADIPENEDETISAKFFPQWFYCNKCNRFKPLIEWWKIWKDDVDKSASMKEFVPPRCGYCASKKEKRTYAPELEQVRFIMTSPDGEIQDIPWRRWTSAEKQVKDDDSENGSILLHEPCCDNQDLRYLKSNKFSDLAGIRIKCTNPECKTRGKEVNLAGLFGLRIFKRNLEDSAGNKIIREGKCVKIFLKPVIRTSNSVYYPILVTSIFLPTDKGIRIDDAEKIKRFIAKGKDNQFIFDALEEKYSLEIIDKFVNSEEMNNYTPELEYRLFEYNFLTKTDCNSYEDPNHNLIFKKEQIDKLKRYGFEQLIGIKKLKITTVQTGYTRQEPKTNDDVMNSIEDKIPQKIEEKHTSKWGWETKYLPAVETFGEGIFLSFSQKMIEIWLERNQTNNIYKKRIGQLFNNCINHEYKAVREKFVSEQHLAKFVLIHTLSHLLIKEFEFLCGYPATSLSERLFVDDNQMHGILIYTVAGAEGSFGGLVSQANESHLLKIIKSSLKRAMDCASDPICYKTEDGQGIGGLNMAACYSCTLLPENACEEFNSYLDRALLIDIDFGFLKGILFS